MKEPFRYMVESISRFSSNSDFELEYEGTIESDEVMKLAAEFLAKFDRSIRISSSGVTHTGAHGQHKTCIRGELDRVSP